MRLMFASYLTQSRCKEIVNIIIFNYILCYAININDFSGCSNADISGDDIAANLVPSSLQEKSNKGDSIRECPKRMSSAQF